MNATLPQPLMYEIIIVLALIAVLIFHRTLRAVLSQKNTKTKEEKVFLYPKAIRVWHWINMALFSTLLFSGLGAIFKIAPKEFLITTHVVVAALFIFVWTFFIAYNALGNFQNYKIEKKGFLKSCALQIKYYLFGILNGGKNPHEPTLNNKFNSLQKLSYLFMMYGIVPLFIISGILEKIKPIHKPMLYIHIYFCTFVTVIFICIHLYMVLSGKYASQKVKSMVDGYERISK